MVEHIKQGIANVIGYSISISIALVLQFIIVWSSWDAFFGGFVANQTLYDIKTFWTVVVVLFCLMWRFQEYKTAWLENVCWCIFQGAMVWSIGLFVSWCCMRHVGLGTLVGNWWSYHMDIYTTVAVSLVIIFNDCKQME